MAAKAQRKGGGRRAQRGPSRAQQRPRYDMLDAEEQRTVLTDRLKTLQVRLFEMDLNREVIEGDTERGDRDDQLKALDGRITNMERSITLTRKRLDSLPPPPPPPEPAEE